MDENDYRIKSLRIQKVACWVQFFGLIFAIMSISFLGFQLREQVKATTAQYDALENSTYQDLMSKQLDVDKLFIDKPGIYKHIFGKQKTPMAKLPPDALSAAYYLLDFFQLIYTQRSRLPALQNENDPGWITWRNTMATNFSEGPVLCELLRDSRAMYGQDFTDYILKENIWCKSDHK